MNTTLIAVRRIVLAILLTGGNAHADSMYDAMRHSDAWHGYIFVSLQMPTGTLIALARESSLTRMPMVLAGFEGPGVGLEQTRAKIQSINTACCGNQNGTRWIIHPRLFDRYQIKSVPAFVVAHGDSGDVASYTKIAGDIGAADALKFIAQSSRLNDIRERAKAIYANAFSSH